ncbi:MAG: glycoside hydrolase family 5 protein [Oscillospiraceae bacterium]
MKIKTLLAAAAAAMLTICTAVHADSKTLTQDNFVHAEGSSVIGTDGRPLLIKSMALGNAVYNNPSQPPYAHHTEDTYRELADMGFNCVRFYINYGLFEEDSAPYVYKQSGFDWLDKNVAWAKKHNIGIVFNMHCPQGGYQSTGNGMALWTDASNQDRLTALWRTIAERYANEPAVWGYALINEPYLPLNGTVEDSVDKCRVLMNRITDAIREVSPYQAIFAETAPAVKPDSGEWLDASKYFEYPLYFTLDDDNVIYEFHNYQPFSFTHQNAEWANTAGVTARYPSNVIASADYESYWVGCETGKEISSSDGWTYFETPEVSLSNDYNVAFPAVAAYGGNINNFVYVDDIRLIEIAPDGTQTRLCEYTFDHDNTGAFNTWSANGKGSMEYSSLFGGCIKLCASQEAFIVSSSSHFEMLEGYRYKATGKIRGTGCDIRIDFAKADNIHQSDKELLESVVSRYHAFSSAYNVPVYMGEFGVIRSGFENNANGTQWIGDMIDLCRKYDIGFNYHTYHETAFGLYFSDDRTLPDPKHRNDELAALFKFKLKDSEPIYALMRLLNVFT